MPKIKIKDFKGIFTNLDENDSNPEACRDSINFLHKRGFLEFVPRHLLERVSMPDTIGDYGPYTWTWETGIYTTLTSDRLTTSLTQTPTSYNVLVLIAKVVDSGWTHRLVFLYDGTSWHELSNNSSPIVGEKPIIDIRNWMPSGTTFYGDSMFSTSKTGTVYFQVEDGRLKIYMPHMAFWVGRIERKIWIKDNAQRWAVTSNGVTTYPYFNYESGYWYIDRLMDYWDYDNQYVWDEEHRINVLEPPEGYNPSEFECAHAVNTWPTADIYPGRRLGIKYDVNIDTDQSHTVGGTAITLYGMHDNKIRWDKYRIGNHWCTRHNIAATDTGIGVTCPWKPIESDPTIWTIRVDTQRTNTLGWDWGNLDDINTNSTQWDNIYMLFDNEMQEMFAKYDDDTWTWATSGWYIYPSGYVSMSYTDFINFTWEYRGDQQIQDVGYDKTTDKRFSIVATMILDDREEIPVKAQIFTLAPTAKFAISIKNIDIPYDVSKRVTRLRFYHRIKDGSDFEMVKEFDFLDEDGTIEDFMFTDEQKTGLTLAGNIGFLWNLEEKPNDLKIITGFRGYVTESGISIGLATTDLVSIYHSTFGGGNLMADLIYDDNRLPVSGIAKLTAVGNADGRLMAFTDNTAYAIDAEEIAGVIGFKVEDTVELGVKNQLDIANIQGGVAVHTMHGIYITNGFETKSISEPIDDIIVTNYTTGRIYYNRYKHILYYKPTNAEDLYQYRFKDAVWERINKTTTEGDVEVGVEVT